MANWTRLIRFTAKETAGKKVHIGQPVDPNMDVGLAFLSGAPVKVYEISGTSALDGTATVTKKLLTVHQLLTPLDPKEVGTVRGLGTNYKDYAAAANMQAPKVPILFYKPITALVDPNDPIIIPPVCQPPLENLADYECELVVVLSKAAKDVKEAYALDYVLGYTVGNDVSFRKHQNASPQWGFSKGFDGSAPMGPVLVSSRAMKDPQDLGLKTILNGKTVQDGNTKDMFFNVKQTIAFLSQGTTLLPGSVIYTGTPAGVGSMLKPVVALKNGDDVRVWCGGGIGTLVNSVEEEGQAPQKAKL